MRDAIVSHLPIGTSRKEIKDAFAQLSKKVLFQKNKFFPQKNASRLPKRSRAPTTRVCA
jgi:hypothetical protein